MKAIKLLLVSLAVALAGAPALRAETGYDAWLRYEALDAGAAAEWGEAMPAAVVVLGDSEVCRAACEELLRGVRGMTGRRLRMEPGIPSENAIVLGTFTEVEKAWPEFKVPEDATLDGFWITRHSAGARTHWLVAGPNDRGVLYGTFALLRKMALRESPDALEVKESPYASIRFLNHWDNPSGMIERGYAGPSIFWQDNRIVEDLGRARDYARLMASLGVNGCSINNVNADPRVVTAAWLPQVARVADVFRPWGVRLLLSLDFASPRKTGGIDTFDPLDPKAVEFWKNTVDGVYGAIPDLAGFVLKADSEGRLGPSEYGRTHADAANVIARALKPHGGILFYRGFVYNHRMDWRDQSLDRAKAAYDNFHKLDGSFEDNVIIQIKHGPIDFQVREPASPLFAGLAKTSQAIELQITQEYLGQQRHVCFIPPMWKEVLDFDMQAKGPGTPVKALAAGKTFQRPHGGFVGVSNVGRDTNWLGHHLAMANLHGFGRLAWNPGLSSEQIADEWTKLTFGHERKAVETVSRILLRSWPAYESYTGPLGAGTLTDIIHVHFGPAVESSEYNGWGQWHRANDKGIGMNRSASGTGYIAQYPPAVAAMYESLQTCPDELLLFMHHVPYTHVLHSGKTVIQHIYDTHYAGAEEAAEFVRLWKGLKGSIDEQRHREVLGLLEYQAGHAVAWRDAINGWFLKKSGIPDAQGRAGRFPGRTEAEGMKMEGYAAVDIKPFETASGEKAAHIAAENRQGALVFRHDGPGGWFDCAVQYFDEDDGVSTFTFLLNGQVMDAWTADNRLPTPSRQPDGHTSTRRTIRALALRTGDEIRIEARADGGENAVIDYVEMARTAD